jgi:predicted ATPase
MSATIINNPNLYVISGGPGAGKTSLLRELAQRGVSCVPEVARQIIQEQVASQGDAVPWGNTARYAELMLERSIADFVKHSGATEWTFFDRGIPDVLCYARLIGLQQDETQRACDGYRYNRLVFIAPPWKEIYTMDAERKQTFTEAIETHRVMEQSYRDCAYEVVELPRVSAERRAKFVLREISAKRIGT